ncbi:MAG: nucleoside/nucleotide kinase family protein [Erysipelotrichaceae bacterium]
MEKEYQINVNGFIESIKVQQEDIESVFLVVIKKLIEMAEKKQDRFFCFFASAPGSGKTSLSLLMQKLASEYFAYDLQVLGIDGFHYHNDYLSCHYSDDHILLKDIKGSQQTFDVDKMYQKLQQSLTRDTYWPLYDRTIHDPIEDAIKVEKKLIIFEGNYLLINNPSWAKIRQFCDYSLMLQVDDNILQDRLITRKQKGGLSLAESKKWYQQVDRKNVETIKNNSIEADCQIIYDGNNYRLLKI